MTALQTGERRQAGDDLFQKNAYRRRFDELAEIHGGDSAKMRQALLAAMKEWVAEVHEAIRRRFEADNGGRRCAGDLSRFQDMLVCEIYGFGVRYIHPSINPTSSERLAIVATGGYGRGLLAPGSDIDLLILLPYKQTAWGESLVEFILYMLWDLGFKVGHATRTIKQCVGTALEDYTIRTSLLDARFLCGENALYDNFAGSFGKQAINGRSREFVEAKLEERNQRHKRGGGSRYLVEPNVKEGKGGLRDLHLLQWLLDYTERDEKLAQAGAAIELSSAEHATFRRCEEFLWSTRCHLHYLTGRSEERISFDVQMAMAERMNYRESAGLRAVERFMKHYFLMARDVGELTRILCSALELKQLKEAPILDRFLGRFREQPVRRQLGQSDFVIELGRINVASSDAFRKDPLNIIRLFDEANRNNVLFHPYALRLLQTSFRLIDDRLREDPEANALFIKMLTDPDNVENTLRKMNEAGVLGRFVPDFGKIVCLMQFNMYHHYTVDEHLIRTIGVLARIATGEYKDDHPLASEIYDSIENSKLLFVALLLHDIAKGRDQDHSEAGREVAEKLCPRLGLSASETELVAWLVENHLVMSHFAQNRDISDPQTISDFANNVRSRKRLKLLLVLTVADIRGVGPGVWNGWKGELLRNLYYETEPVLAGGHTRRDQGRRILQIKEKLRAGLSDWPQEQRESFIEMHYDDYWLKTDEAQQMRHAELVRESDTVEGPMAVKVVTDRFTEMTELMIFAPEHPLFLAKVAGACAVSGANIAAAQISTTRTGYSLDNFYLQREFKEEADELRRAENILGTVRQLMQGDKQLDNLMQEKGRLRGAIKAFSIDPMVSLDNSLSKHFTVIEIEALDRPGLLFDVTRTLAELNLSVASAHVSTYGEKAIDAFYVSDLVGHKIRQKTRWNAIREQLIDVLAN